MPFDNEELPEEDFIIGFDDEEDTEQPTEEGDVDIPALMDARMNELPEHQKTFFLDHLTPETLAMLGLVLGDVALQYFQPLTAMDKTIVVQDKEELDADSEPLVKPGATPADTSIPQEDPDQFTF